MSGQHKALPTSSSAHFLLIMMCSLLLCDVISFTTPVTITTRRTNNNYLSSLLSAKSNNNANVNNDMVSTTNNVNQSSSRRDILQKSLTFGSLVITPFVPISSATAKMGGKSRTEGYAIQHTEKEWSDMLTSTQYFILRNGGTESPYSSILEGEERDGTYVCAGCQSELFDAKQKFHSGTGWPSFAKGIGDNVEIEDVSKIQFQLAGAELRCHACGGHLGDVFADGYLFPGTPALATGKRYCIDGAALVFAPAEGGEKVRGDLPSKNGGRPVFPG